MPDVTKDSFPHLHEAFVVIECDQGGHLIGTVYPGEPIDLERFEVPVAWAHVLPRAEEGLKNLKELEPEWFKAFCNGAEHQMEAILRQQGDLDTAYRVLNDFFNDWAPEDAPPPEAGPHFVYGEFKSDKYAWSPPGFVPLKITDPMAQRLLWAYAQKRRSVDSTFADDLQAALRSAGFEPGAE